MQETIDTENRVRAFVYHGEWVADCTRPYCNSTEFLFEPVTDKGPRVRQREFFTCSNCGWETFIDWPSRMLQITEVLLRRPVPETRNWYPADHPTALKFGIPHGQSVQDLLAESLEHGVL
jgi:hypothetical protein